MSGGGFVMVPDWLRAKKPSGNAILAYINLGSFGTWNPGSATYEECRPAWQTLAAEMNVSEATAKRAVKELVDLGAATRSLRWNEDGSSAPSVYRLVFGILVEPRNVSAGGRGVGSPVTPPPSGEGVTGEPPGGGGHR